MAAKEMRYSKNTIGDRARCVVASCGTDAELADQTNIPRTTWHNVRYVKQRINEDHMEAIRELAPQYAFWIMTGATLPEAGQIAPPLATEVEVKDS